MHTTSHRRCVAKTQQLESSRPPHSCSELSNHIRRISKTIVEHRATNHMLIALISCVRLNRIERFSR